MLKFAVIDDEAPDREQLADWIRSAWPDARIDTIGTRIDAEAAVKRERYDLISLDIEMSPERNAGVAIIREATRKEPVPVLVVSAMPSEIYRGVMKALEAWDYLQKPLQKHEYVETIAELLRLAQNRREPNQLRLDPLNLAHPEWKGARLFLSAGQQRILNVIYERRGEPDPTATYEQLLKVLKSGKNKPNLKKQIADIKMAFKDIDPNFSSIVVEPMRGYRWVNR